MTQIQFMYSYLNVMDFQKRIKIQGHIVKAMKLQPPTFQIQKGMHYLWSFRIVKAQLVTESR